MRRQVRKRKCKNCNDYFLPDHRNRKRQKFCSKPPCRKASKADSQRRWLNKPENQDTFKCADNVDRVRQWRASHPGYWRKTPDKKKTLQDPLSAKTVDNRAGTENLTEDALQDVLSAQTPVIIGLIAQLSGYAQQDDIASYARRLRELGDDVLNRQFPDKGGSHDLKTPFMPPTDPETTGRVQLARSSAGP